MIGPETMIQRLAFALIRLALRLLPPSGNEWAKAMLAEFYYIDSDFNALAWAAGCVIATIKMRFEAMLIGNLKVSRWVLGPELVLCFTPLTFVWLDGIFGVSGIIRLNYGIVQEYFFSSSVGTFSLLMMISTAIFGISGPLSFILAMRIILLNRQLPGNNTGVVLITGPLVLGVIHITCWLLIGIDFRIDHYAGILMVSILPSLGVAHLFHVYSPNQDKAVTV